MTNSIKHISFESKKIIEPVKWYELKRIVSSDSVKERQDTHKKISKVRKSDTTNIEDYQEKNNSHNRNIFYIPYISRVWVDPKNNTF